MSDFLTTQGTGKILKPPPLAERMKWLSSLRNSLLQEHHQLTTCVERELNRHPVEVLATDILPSIGAIHFLEKNATKLLRDKKLGRGPLWLMGTRTTICRRPWGTVGIIGTWNYPIFLNLVPILQALVAGNRVLWKPSEQAPETAKMLMEFLLQVGISEQMLTMFPATREAGKTLLEQELDYLVFTGSHHVGKLIARELAPRLIPSTLELSGCDCLIIMPDADIPMVAQAIRYSMLLNHSQTCIAIRRVLVPSNLFEPFQKAIQEEMQNLPICQLQTMEQATKIKDLLENAHTQGGEIFPGYVESDPQVVRPSLIFHATPKMQVCQEPAFGPVAAILKYEQLEDIPGLFHATSYNLSTCVFSENPEAENNQTIVSQLRTGTVIYNDVINSTAHPATPFPARGASGWGVTQGPEGLLAMTTPQVIVQVKGKFRPHYDLDRSEATSMILNGMLQWSYARGLFARVRGLVRLIRGVLQMKPKKK